MVDQLPASQSTRVIGFSEQENLEQPHTHAGFDGPPREANLCAVSASGSEVYVLIPITCDCGSRFEAHIIPGKGTHGGNLIECPDCGGYLLLPYKLRRPLVRLK
jgi:DNA-directed RNA polymerase subunit RPC12/RpoP